MESIKGTEINGVVRSSRKPRIVQEEAFVRQITMPLLQIEETVIKSRPEDVEWSYALREFCSFSEDIQDAVWALFKRPDSSILRALHSLMSKAITKKIMHSGVQAVANLDLIEAKDVVVIDKECVSLVGKVSLLLYEMRDDKFEKRSLEYITRGHDRPSLIENKTWMSQSLVESMILSLQHSHLRTKMNMDETMIGNLLKAGEKLKPAVYDFFCEQITVLFDERILLVPVYKNNDSTFARALGCLIGAMTRSGVCDDKTGVAPRVVNYIHFRNFIKECESVDANFPSLFFCYLYPNDAEKIFGAYIDHVQDDDFLLYGAPSLESWVDAAVASKTVNGQDFHFSIEDDENAEVVAHISAMERLDLALVDGPGVDEFGEVESYRVNHESYLDEIIRQANYSVEDYLISVQGKKNVGISSEMLHDLALHHSRFVKVAAHGEFLRLVRLNGHDSRIDRDTNLLANMFPDQYQVFYQDILTDGLIVPDPSVETVAVTNEVYMGQYLSLRYPKEKVRIVERFAVAEAITNFEREGDILMLDLNQGLYDSEARGTGRFSKSWMSPFLAPKDDIRSALDRIYMLMGGDDYMNNDDRLTAWIRVPILNDFYSFIILFKIMTSMVHRVSVTYPKGMHEPYFDLKIYPVEYSKGPIVGQLTIIIARMAAVTLYARNFFDHFANHLQIGINARHKIWEFAAVGIVYKWKSHRYKMLKRLKFKIVIDVERVKHIRQIVTHDAGRRIRRDNAAKRAKVMKDNIKALHRKIDSNMSRLRMGIRPKGMIDLDKTVP